MFRKKRTMSNYDFRSYSLKDYCLPEMDELQSDEDEGGSEPVASEEYFTGAYERFVTGLQPSPEEQKNAMMMAGPTGINNLTRLPLTYAERCKQLGRLGPFKTELDKSSIYGQCILGNEQAKELSPDPSSTLYEMDGQEPLALDIEATS